jgi:folate-binding protein YgfZ
MAMTALQAQGKGLGAAGIAEYKAGEYRGATTAARFGDPQIEFDALRGACGVYDLGYRAKISLTGGDRVRWLNGMVTNNIRDLAVGQGVYAFLLNPQGHILGDLFAYNRGDSIAVDTDLSQLEKILATFDHYIIMDDVEVTNLSEQSTADQLTALGVSGPESRSVLPAAGLTIPDMQSLQFQSVNWRGADCSLVKGEDGQRDAYEIWIAQDRVRDLWDALLAARATAVGAEAIEMYRIVSGIPRYGVDIRERDLPQETEQARALNFNKGCYVGQEIVERIRSRGAVHRKFTGFLAEGTGQITAGMKIVAGDKEVGEITSATSVLMDAAEKTIALGYIRREVAVPGREVLIGSTKAMVVQLPLAESSVAPESVLERHPA